MLGSSLVTQWQRIHLPVQDTRVPSLIQEDPTCRRATKPMGHNYWTCALEPGSRNYWPHVPHLLKPRYPGAHAPQQEKPLKREAHAPHLKSSPCLPMRSDEGPAQPKISLKKRSDSSLPEAGAPPVAKVMRKEAQHTQRRDRASGVPLEILEPLPPKTRVCLLSALCFHLHLWLYGGLSPTTSLWKKELTYSSS